ncbi:MAG: hypothetical protein H6825_07325 [Planctomycetes bacterium]|nr:hypothetical protein [Planctomycetota bacterium]
MLRRLVASLLCLALFVPSVAAQHLDGQWFKVSVKAKGLASDPELGTSKAKGKFTVYLFVQSADPPVFGGVSSFDYDFDVYSEVSDGVWQVVSSGSFSTPLDEKAMYGDPDQGIAFDVAVPALGEVDTISVHFTASLKVKTDKEDALKSASFKSLGGLIPSGTSAGEDVIGGATVSGKTIDPSKLPAGIIES